MLSAVHTRALTEREMVSSPDGIDLTVKTFNAGKLITEMKVAPSVISEVGKEGGFEILAFAFLDPGSGIIWCVPTLRNREFNT